jgi:16S rRNA processing protein RimM
VKRRRKKAEASAREGQPTPSPARTKPASKPRKEPQLRSRDERMAIASAPPVKQPRESRKQSEPTAAPKAKSTAPAAAATSVASKFQEPAPRPKEQSEPDEGFVAVGRILAPFGLKGELKVLSLTENPARFRPKARVYAGQQPVTIAAVREAGAHLYITLKGFSDRTSVEKFRLTLLQVPESDLPELEEGEYYRFQLVGLQVEDRSGTPLGVLEEVLETGANDVYRVRTPEGKDILLAHTPDVVISIDVGAKRMVVDPPEWT